jgi:RNA polymerase sigma factor (sigma-70 family)
LACERSANQRSPVGLSQSQILPRRFAWNGRFGNIRRGKIKNGKIVGKVSPGGILPTEVRFVRELAIDERTMNEGDREGLIVELVRTKLPALVLFARQWKHDSAEDVVQEAFLRLMRLAEPPQEPVAWLFAAVRNASNQHLRTQERRRSRENISLAEKKPWFSPAEGEDELVAELQSLPFDCRTVIVAKIWGNLTFEQIADTIGTSKSSAHRKYDEGLALLRKKWKES